MAAVLKAVVINGNIPFAAYWNDAEDFVFWRGLWGVECDSADVQTVRINEGQAGAF